MACARVEALRSHGYMEEARRLAVAVVFGMKHLQRQNCFSYYSRKNMVPQPAHSSSSSGPYLGQPLNTIRSQILYSILNTLFNLKYSIRSQILYLISNTLFDIAYSIRSQTLYSISNTLFDLKYSIRSQILYSISNTAFMLLCVQLYLIL